MDRKRLRLLRSRMETELRDNILNFWLRYAPDAVNGGFVGIIHSPCEPDASGPRSLVLNARILWTFSASYRVFGNPACLLEAERAYDYLMKHFKDAVNGGMFWMLDGQGIVTSSKKQVYGNAFAIYALTEFHLASGRRDALDEAVSLFLLLDRHAHDSVHRGYIEALSEDWSPCVDMALSARELNAPKSMNTHLHVLEGFTNLLRVWDDPRIRERLREILLVTLQHIVDPVEDRFQLYFDMNWHPLSEKTSFGHDIEGSWLIDEAAAVLGDPALTERAAAISERMARRARLTGMDPVNGGMYDELRGNVLHKGKIWWVQAEAIVGFMNAWQRTGEEAFLEEMLDTWLFTDAFLVDHACGEWFDATDESGKQITSQSTEQGQKAGPWKCPYHNARMCLEMMHRLDATLKE